MRWRHFILGTLLLGLTTPLLHGDDKHYVQVRNAPVRDHHAPLAKVLATLKFAEPVTEVGKFGTGWIKISARAASVAGWVRKSSLSKKETKLDTKGSTGSATLTEQSHAGRGIREATDQYVAEKNLEAAMRKVRAIHRDRTTSASIDQIVAFLRAGQVQPKEGN